MKKLVTDNDQTIESARQQFQDWRRSSRIKQTPISEHLWQVAVALCRVHSGIELLAKVYSQEKIVKELNLSPCERLVRHQSKSAQLMQELKNWCDCQIANKNVEPNSSLGKAIRYIQKRWDKLTRFLTVEGPR